MCRPMYIHHTPTQTVRNNDAALDRKSHACHFLSVQVHYLPQDGGGEEHTEPSMAGLHHPSSSPLQWRLRQVMATHWLHTGDNPVRALFNGDYDRYWLNTGYILG